jgi:hypothetical protein
MVGLVWPAQRGKGPVDPHQRSGQGVVSQKHINTVFGVKKHGWRGGEGGRLCLAPFLAE